MEKRKELVQFLYAVLIKLGNKLIDLVYQKAMELAKAGKKQFFIGCFWQKAAHACFLQKQLFLLLPTLARTA